MIHRLSATLSCGNTLLICSVRLIPSRLISCGLQSGDIAAAKEDSARVGPQHARDEVEEGRLTGAVRTDDRVEATSGQGEVEMIDRG